MVIVNPPWNFDALLRRLCEDLARAFGGAAGGTVEWVTAPA
jgi:23S rRNA A2030 N6-methylase RlmJ